MKRTLLIQAWAIQKIGHSYYLLYAHWVYLNEIVKYYDKVCLISLTDKNENTNLEKYMAISKFENVEVYELPYSDSYINSVRHISKYIKAYKKLRNFDVVYARYPTPFGWLQKVFNKEGKRIIHFVGDPIDTIEKNPNLSNTTKFIYKWGFSIENEMYLWACRGARVYTNGRHIAEKLRKRKVEATPVVSSTLISSDFYIDERKVLSIDNLSIIYVGYLRKAKGVDIILKSFKSINLMYPKAKLTIVGTGEMEIELKKYVEENKIKNVFFVGHIDNRDELNEMLRKHDVFCFASLSEGSPRVVLEAMANGLVVISTPVGSLPYEFEDGEDIKFVDYNNHNDFVSAIDELLGDNDLYAKIRFNSNRKVKNMTVGRFIKKIFNEE